MTARKVAVFVCALMLLLTTLVGCNKTTKAPDVVEEIDPASVVNPNLGTEEVTLVVAAPWQDSRAFEAVASAFMNKYPNCTIEYEYVQDYYPTLITRLNTDPLSADLFYAFNSNLQKDSELLPHALNLFSVPELDLSNTFDGLVENYVFKGDEGSAKQIYAIPTGAEVRGLYVNKTLLKSLGLSVPTNRTELLAACQVLLDAGYIPMQSNPSSFAHQLMYPSMMNRIANASDYQATYNRVNNCETGVSTLFEDDVNFVYTLVEKGYYNYKYVETNYELFTKDLSDDGISRDFLNIVADGESYKKIDDLGRVAFMPSTASLENTLDKWKEDCNSQIEFEFILAPVGDDGGYAYLSPAHGLSINKSSANLDWAIEFMNFFFTPSVSEMYAAEQNIIPDTKTAFDTVSAQYDIPSNQISHVGQVTFDYNLYKIITETLLNVSKGNNPKYMIDNGDGTTSIYPFEHYMEEFEADFQAVKSES